MNKIKTSQSKTLKLVNVLKYRCLFQEEDFDFNVAIEQMKSYIKVKGVQQIGPLIQYTKVFMNDENELDLEMVMMLQCNNFLHKVEEPYSMESIIRLTDCIYCRYIGPEEKMKLAYNKIEIEAFETDTELSGENYTIFVDTNDEDETITADVFMPRKYRN